MESRLTDNITVNAQSSIRIAGEKILYFDPYEVKEEAHDADVIFITHEHYDHFQPQSIQRVGNEHTMLIAPLSMKQKALEESYIPEGRCCFFTPGERKAFEGYTVETVAAYNNRKPFHPKGKQWLGYVVTMDRLRYFVAGDTDPNEDNRKIRCDVALVPIGGTYTMDKKHGADFVANLKPRAVIPTHYGDVVGKPHDGADFKDYVEIIDPEIAVELKL